MFNPNAPTPTQPNRGLVATTAVLAGAANSAAGLVASLMPPRPTASPSTGPVVRDNRLPGYAPPRLVFRPRLVSRLRLGQIRLR